jgi:hypothetical protein
MQRFNENTKAAKKYAKQLKKIAKNFEKDYLMPIVSEMVADVVEIAAGLAPVNMGTLRGLFTATVNGSGRLPKDGSPESIRSTVKSNLKKARLRDEITVENQAPYAEMYEFGLFQPATPKYAKYGGSEAAHVPASRRAEKLGKVLIVDGYNVTAPNGMVSDAIQIVNANIASNKYKLGKIM